MDKVFNLLKDNGVMSLATSCGDKPRVSVMEYYVIGGAILFATSPGSIKAANLAQNNRVSLSVNKMPVFATIDGTVSQPSPEEITEYDAKLFSNHPEFKELLDKGIMQPFRYFKVAIEAAYYNDYSAGMTPTEVIKA